MAPTSSGFTIHLTQAESDRIRDVLHARQKKCDEVKGQTRLATDKHDLVSQATQASLLADMSGQIDPGITASDREGSITVLGLPSPFVPCVMSSEELEAIELADCKMETRHHGKKLGGKRVAPVNHLNAYSWTVIEDDEGTVERLELYLHKAKGGEDIFDSLTDFYIKEPYMTLNEQGQPTLRVYHPSDICKRLAGENAHSKATDPAKSKQKGNNALKEKEWFDAFRFYSEGIAAFSHSSSEDKTILHDLHRNRAHVGLIIGRFDDAQADGEAALTGKDDDKNKGLDAKAHLRAGTAAYNLGHFDEAERHFFQQLELTSEDEEGKSWLRLTKARLKEQREGDHDLSKLARRVTPARPRVDVASFLGGVIVKDSALGGRGLFAAKSFAVGDIVLCEKAFHVSWSHGADSWLAMAHTAQDDQLKVFPAGMAQAIVQKLQNNPSQIERVLDLHSDYAGTGKKAPTVDGEPAIDVLQIHEIIGKNAFGPGDLPGQERPHRSSIGLWITAAYANHSCMPNAAKEFVGDLMILRATQPIKSGDEITHSYVGEVDYDARHASLKSTWGFECACKLCIVEAEDSPEVRAQRRDLALKAQGFVEQTHPSQAKRVVIARGQRLATALEQTYDAERYGDLPRAALAPLQSWLEIAKKKR